MTKRMMNTPKTVEEAIALEGTLWQSENDVREIANVESATISQYDKRTVLADVYWRKKRKDGSFGPVRKTPTPMTTFRTWLNKAVKIG